MLEPQKGFQMDVRGPRSVFLTNQVLGPRFEPVWGRY